MLKTALVALCVTVAVPAIAAEGQATAKAAADIRISSSRIQIEPTDGGAYIELAQAYLRAGRTGDAVLAYRAALTRDNEMMLTRNGASVWSHRIARDALALMPQYAAR
jgi:cytochrome c-type biogenesis protein CcmH/NrfG